MNLTKLLAKYPPIIKQLDTDVFLAKNDSLGIFVQGDSKQYVLDHFFEALKGYMDEILAKYPPTIRVSKHGVMAFNDTVNVVAAGDTKQAAREHYALALRTLVETFGEPEKGVAYMKLNRTVTNRGFSLITFTDQYGTACSLQKSSLATEDAIWFGPDKADPMVLHGDAKSVGVDTSATSGWVPYPVPDCVQMTTRMHLTRDQVKELLPYLQHFADTGELQP